MSLYIYLNIIYLRSACLYFELLIRLTRPSFLLSQIQSFSFLHVCLSDLSCWWNARLGWVVFSHALVEKAPFDEPPPYRYFLQILHIQPLCQGEIQPTMIFLMFRGSGISFIRFLWQQFCKNKFPDAASPSSEEIALISSREWFQYSSSITSSSTLSLLLTGFWIGWNVLDSYGDAI